MKLDTIYTGDALTFAQSLPDESVNCVITSPPYFNLRDYGVEGQIGNEQTPAEYVAKMVMLFREIRRALKAEGTVWLNLADTYGGGSRGAFGKETLRGNTQPGFGVSPNLPEKNLLMIPARVAIALQDDGWILRSEIIWHKPNPMPESVTDRPTRSHEMVYMLTRSSRYWYDADAIREKSNGSKNRVGFRGGNGQPYVHDSTFDNSYQKSEHKNLVVPGRTTHTMHSERAAGNDYAAVSEDRNKRDVWTIPTHGTPEAHFATFPEKLIEPMILAGCPPFGIVYDPFIGSGTTALVARRFGRHYIGSELNPDYVAIAEKRLSVPFTQNMFEVIGK